MLCCRDTVWVSGGPYSPVNSFQVVLAWDATRTYTLFFYPSGGLMWDEGGFATSPAAAVCAGMTLICHCPAAAVMACEPSQHIMQMPAAMATYMMYDLHVNGVLDEALCSQGMALGDGSAPFEMTGSRTASVMTDLMSGSNVGTPGCW